MEFLTENRIKVDPPKKPKKLTATRFATILGLNAWATPFEAWCAITRTYEEPFEDTIYTKAGKVIEPKVIEYLNDVMFMDIKSPTDVYGPDYFKKTWGDFFPDQKTLGGMWDAIGDDFVVEIKTTKRAEDWSYDVPIYYKLQAALYAWLLGFDNVVVTVSFLEDKDYANPEAHTYKLLFEHLRAPRRAPALKIYFTEIKLLAKFLLQSVAICCSLLHFVEKAKKDVVTLSTKTITKTKTAIRKAH